MTIRSRLGLLCLAAAASLSLAACNPPSKTLEAAEAVPLPPAASPGVRICAKGDVTDEKILLEAENAYTAASTLYLQANQGGLIPPASKEAVKGALGGAYAALQMGRKAYAACDAPSLFGKVGAALGLIGQARALLPKLGA